MRMQKMFCCAAMYVSAIAYNVATGFPFVGNTCLLQSETIALSPEEEIADFTAILSQYGFNETNHIVRMRQVCAIRGLARVGSSNSLERLAQIWRSDSDYARHEAHDAALVIAARFGMTNEIVSIAMEIATNGIPFRAFSADGRKETFSRAHMYKTLFSIDSGRVGEVSISMSDPMHDTIRRFLRSRAGTEAGKDGVVYDIMLSSHDSDYRHSQQRRDNLALLRMHNLDEKLNRYIDAAQADAAQRD